MASEDVFSLFGSLCPLYSTGDIRLRSETELAGLLESVQKWLGIEEQSGERRSLGVLEVLRHWGRGARRVECELWVANGSRCDVGATGVAGWSGARGQVRVAGVAAVKSQTCQRRLGRASLLNAHVHLYRLHWWRDGGCFGSNQTHVPSC